MGHQICSGRRRLCIKSKNKPKNCFLPLSKESYRKELLDNQRQYGDLRPIQKTSKTDGFAERREENMQTSGVDTKRMIGDHNADQIFVSRKFTSNVTDFGSTLKNHPDSHEKM